jgi:SAM-dependent methyltransferase
MKRGDEHGIGQESNEAQIDCLVPQPTQTKWNYFGMASLAYRSALVAEIKEICDFLSEFGWLLEAHGARFFTRDYAKLIPQEWYTTLLQLSETSLYLLPATGMDVFNNSNIEVPDPLRLFLQKCEKFAMPSKHLENPLSLLSLPPLPEPTTFIDPLSSSPFHDALTKVMRPKKRHEVEILAELVYRLALSYGCHSILDLGCGQGYLMQILSYYYKLNVIGVDSSKLQTNGAIKRAQGTQLILRSMYHKNKSLDPNAIDITPVFMTLVCPIDTKLTMAQLTNLASQAPPPAPITSDSPYPKRNQAYPFRIPEVHPLLSEEGVIVVGLHTCGDLAPTTLRLFHESPTVRAMINIGCCYNLMTEGLSSGATDICSPEASPSCSANSDESKLNCVTGYPLSSVCRSTRPNLSRAARVLACQSVAKRPAIVKRSEEAARSNSSETSPSLSNSAPEEDEDEDTPALPLQLVHRSQVFRAVLQVVYERHCDNQANVYSGQYSKDLLVDFPTYARHLLARNNLDPKLSDIELLELWKSIGVPNYDSLVAFDNLRVCLAPVVEALVIKDRLLFLLEQDENTGIYCQHKLFPVFDADISPRNMAFLSLKA